MKKLILLVYIGDLKSMGITVDQNDPSQKPCHWPGSDEGSIKINKILGNSFAIDRTRYLRCPECGVNNHCAMHYTVTQNEDSNEKNFGIPFITSVIYVCSKCESEFVVNY